jgi:hypothetical protein
MHILLHVFNTNLRSYIRIINTKCTEDYKKEFNTIYGLNENINEQLHIFYNYGDMYERIISDLYYKKFKQFKFKSVSRNLYEVTNIIENANILELFKNYMI